MICHFVDGPWAHTMKVLESPEHHIKVPYFRALHSPVLKMADSAFDDEKINVAKYRLVYVSDGRHDEFATCEDHAFYRLVS